ncbi:MAG: DUF917 domain-containing protein [Waddliaceae bacterium]
MVRGGGGDPTYDLLMAKQQLEEGRTIRLVELQDLEENALVAPVAFMGAPLVCIEKLPSGREFEAILQRIHKTLGKSVTHLLPAEIGGANAFTPLTAGAQFDLPVVDADTLGRAFPELQMSSCNLKGVSPSPAFLADTHGNVVVVKAKDAHDLEHRSREITVEMGSSAALCTYLMSGKQCQGSVIPGTLSRGIAIGKSLRQGEDPVKALLDCADGIVLGHGMIVDIDQRIEEGFLKGAFSVHGDDNVLKVFYQNEYLAVFNEKEAIALTPDIIIPIEQDSGTPITSESLVYGLRVVLIAIPGPELWKTPEGLKLVGPQYFGYSKESS